MKHETLHPEMLDTELVERLYAGGGEENRLIRSNAARVEFITHVHYIEKYLRPGARILDIGAGTGRYSLYFAEKGYCVDALELSDDNMAVFRSKIRPDMPLVLRHGNGTDLSAYGDQCFDAVLLMGPLYHLHSRAEQKKCIAQARRVCKKDGVIFFAFISNDMVILTEMMARPQFFSENTYDHDTFKVTDFPFVFHTVDAARELLGECGVKIEKEVASDGLSELLADRINALDEYGYQQYLRYHFYACEKKELLGHSNHLLFIGR